MKRGLCVLILAIGALSLVGFTATTQEQELRSYQATNPVVEEILGKVSAESIAGILRKLASFETRHTLSDTVSDTRGIGAARRWIRDTFAGYSPRLQIYLDSHTIPEGSRRMPAGTVLKNVVAVLPGSHPELKKKHIVLGGHYDTINLDPVREGDTYERRDPNRPAPGVDDDASGVAVAMEAARIFSQYELDKTLIFIAFVAEEQGLLGAADFARKAKAEEMDIEAVLNMDMIASSVRGGGARSRPFTVRVFSEGPEDSPSRQLARYMETIGERYVPEMDIDIIFRRDRFGRGGDHTAFNREGYPAVRLVEANEDYSNQHSYNDTFENLDMDYLMRNARVEIATAATLAMAPSAPRLSRLGRGEGYDAQPMFMSAEGDVSGYVVAIRSTTAPRWEKLMWMGIPETTERRGQTYHQVILPGIDIDEVVIGIGALGRQGCPSLIAVYVR